MSDWRDWLSRRLANAALRIASPGYRTTVGRLIRLGMYHHDHCHERTTTMSDTITAERALEELEL